MRRNRGRNLALVGGRSVNDSLRPSALRHFRIFARRPFSASQHHHGGQKAEQHDAHGNIEGPILAPQLVFAPRPHQQVEVFQQLHRQPHQNRDRRHAQRAYFAIGKQPVNQKQGQNRDGYRRKLEERQADPQRYTPAESKHVPQILLVECGQEKRQERQPSADENQAQAQQLIFQIAAVGGHAPNTVQCDFERLENSISGDQQQNQRCDLHGPARLHHGNQVAPDEILFTWKIIRERDEDGVYGRGPAEAVAAQRDHHDEERKKREQDTGRHSKRMHVHFGLHEIAQRGRAAPLDARPARLEISVQNHGSRTLGDLDSQRVFEVLAADARAFFGGPAGRGIQLHRQPSVPADLVELRFDRRKIYAAVT